MKCQSVETGFLKNDDNRGWLCMNEAVVTMEVEGLITKEIVTADVCEECAITITDILASTTQ